MKYFLACIEAANNRLPFYCSCIGFEAAPHEKTATGLTPLVPRIGSPRAIPTAS